MTKKQKMKKWRLEAHEAALADIRENAGKTAAINFQDGGPIIKGTISLENGEIFINGISLNGRLIGVYRIID